MASTLNNAQNTYIANGTFSTTTKNIVQGLAKPESLLDTLHKRAAPNAILNAGGHADEVGCHPGTRTEVLDRIEKWRDARDSQTPPIFWLSGPAGAGKTAIVQTLAERCRAQDIPQANFFFSRTDRSRNSLSPLVATLVSQIVLLYPPLRDLLADVLFITGNPLVVLNSTLEDQLLQLIVTPLHIIRETSPPYLAPLLLIDGLDECESGETSSQQRVLRALDEVLTKSPHLFRLLVASRDEPQIRAAFDNLSSRVLPLYLDAQYTPEEDIRAFVIDKFEQVRKTHPLGHTLRANWPSARDIDDIVRKSSGQFLYASTLLRFIADSPTSPERSLTRVHRGAAKFVGTAKAPSSHLDALYTFILSRVDDQDALKAILHAQILLSKCKLESTAGILGPLLWACNPKYTDAVVHACFATLTPIARYRTDDLSLVPHHESFPDYLLDKARSGRYFMDVDAFIFDVQPAIRAALGTLERGTTAWRSMRGFANQALMQLRRLPSGFLARLTLEPTPFDHTSVLSGMDVEHLNVFNHLYHLRSCDDDVTNYKRILRHWINVKSPRYALTNGPSSSTWPPCSHRYLAMACVERAITTEPAGWIDVALRPGTAADVRETTVWLDSLLHCIYKTEYPDDVQECNRLLQRWASWATSNNVLPSTRRFSRWNKVTKWSATHFGFGSRPE